MAAFGLGAITILVNLAMDLIRAEAHQLKLASIQISRVLQLVMVMPLLLISTELFGHGGKKTKGILDDGTTRDRNIPTLIGVDTNWQSIAVSPDEAHILAVKTDGSLWDWGSNSYGQLDNWTIG
jgi:alpha-tubulin suppressor-like RCC1 family protein